MAVIPKLSEEECYLAAILQDRSGLDIAEFSWYAPDRPDGCFRAWSYQWPWWRNSDPLQIDQCVAGGQRVLTARGWVPIEDVAIGDEVLTHKGRWKPVTWVWDRGVQEVVKVRGQGHHGLFVTPDHGLYARRARRASQPKDGHKGKKLLASEWLTPAAWEWNNGSGVMHANWGSPAAISGLGGVPVMRQTTRSRYLVADVDDTGWLWLYGLYLAEGSTFSKGSTRRAVWSVHEDEVDHVEKTMRAVGLRPVRAQVRGEKCFTLTVNSAAVRAWLVEHGGKGAGSKRLAPWVYGLPAHQRQAVLDGLLYGDGHLRPDGGHTYSSVSHDLALGVRLLAQTLGYSTGFRLSRGSQIHTISGRVVRCRPAWAVDVFPLAPQRRPHVQIIDDIAWSPVVSVAPAGAMQVYDLEVEDDHSFVVEGVIVSNCARSVGKSLSIKVRAFAFPFVFPGQEMVVTAPELIHLEPIANLIESQFFNTRLGREMIVKKRNGVTHRPFMMNFENGARIIGRIPQKDGKGVKGIHPIVLEMDEAQDYPKPGWVELTETLKMGFDDAQWRAHGVSRGVRDKFFDYTQPKELRPKSRSRPEDEDDDEEEDDLEWTVHRITAMHRPNWTARERRRKIKQYGSRDDPDYRRNILGAHGDATNPLFVLDRLMRCVDTDLSSPLNSQDYFELHLKNTELQDHARFMGLDPTVQEDLRAALLDKLELPERHKNYDVVWIGMDVGYTSDPSEILIFAEYHVAAAEAKADKRVGRAVPATGMSRIKCIGRISLRYMDVDQQADTIIHLIDHYRPRAYAVDKSGNGLPLYQRVMSRAKQRVDAEKSAQAQAAMDCIRGYNFGEKVLVDIDGSVKVEPSDDTETVIKKAGIERLVIEYSTDKLREFVDDGRLMLPYDRELVSEFQGMTFSYSKATMDTYGRRRRIFQEGTFHAFDAARMAAMALAQSPIEAFAKTQKKRKPVIDRFGV